MPDRDDEMTDHELDQPATRRDLRHEVLGLAEKLRSLERHFDDRLSDQNEELRRHLDDRLKSQSEELRRHFNIVAESFKADFANLFDWAQSTTSTMGSRIDGVESRVPRLERRRKN
jgi:hypothetical protein